MSAADLSHFDELVSRYLDDELTQADAAELVALLAEPPLATRFLEITRLNSEIGGLLAAPVPDAAMVELVRADIEKSLAGTRPASDVPLRIAERPQPRASTLPTVSITHARPPKRKVGLRRLAWAAVFVVFAALAGVFIFNRTRSFESPTVASVQGEVRFVGPAGERSSTSGRSWQRGETLKTVGPNSVATMKFRDGSQFDFDGDNTVVVNESSKDGFRVRLEHGSMKATLKKQPVRRPFVFATQDAEAIVVGTKLRLIVSAHSTRLEVTEGEVRLRRRHDGAEVQVRANQYAVVASNVPFIAKPIHSDPHHQ